MFSESVETLFTRLQHLFLLEAKQKPYQTWNALIEWSINQTPSGRSASYASFSQPVAGAASGIDKTYWFRRFICLAAIMFNYRGYIFTQKFQDKGYKKYCLEALAPEQVAEICETQGLDVANLIVIIVCQMALELQGETRTERVPSSQEDIFNPMVVMQPVYNYFVHGVELDTAEQQKDYSSRGDLVRRFNLGGWCNQAQTRLLLQVDIDGHSCTDKIITPIASLHKHFLHDSALLSADHMALFCLLFAAIDTKEKTKRPSKTPRSMAVQFLIYYFIRNWAGLLESILTPIQHLQ